MKKTVYAVMAAALALQISCKEGADVYKDASAPVEKRVESLLSQMTLREKVMQLQQYNVSYNDNPNNIGDQAAAFDPMVGSMIYVSDNALLRNELQRRAMEESRLGIPILFGYDVIHGFRTIFPIPLAQSCSFNPELTRQGAVVAAAEAYSSGVDWTFSPMVDIARDARWGRIMETFGEDPYTSGQFAAAAVKGYQGDDLSLPGTIAACLKHYVGYGASEAGRDYVPTEISRQTLWDTYLPSFEAGVKAGAATLMSSFNNISGTPASANHYTLTHVVKEMWDHQGFIVADWAAVEQLMNQGMAKDGVEAVELAMNAGLDMDMCDGLYDKNLEQLVNDGKVSMERVDDAVRRVLRVKFQLGLFDKPYTDILDDSERILKPESKKLAEQAASESMVLLENNGVLPLKADAKIALIGPMVNSDIDMLGAWSGRGKAADVVNIEEGMRAEFGNIVAVARGCNFDGEDRSGFDAALAAARRADVVVLCLGERRSWVGENASRSTIALPEIQEELLEYILKAGKPVVTVLTNGRSLDLTRISPRSSAVLEAWEGGIMAGPAIAGLLSGKYNPSGKLTVTFPYTTGQIPIYYNRRSSARTGTQGLYQNITSNPMYEFGYGLSYSDFEYSPVTLSAGTVGHAGTVTAQVTVTNKSKVDGMETVIWYIRDPYCTITRPMKEVRHFEKKMVKAGESVTYTFEICPDRDLCYVNEEGEKVLEPGEFYIMAGGSRETLTVE